MPGNWETSSPAQCNYRALLTLPFEPALQPWDRVSVKSEEAILQGCLGTLTSHLQAPVTQPLTLLF